MSGYRNLHEDLIEARVLCGRDRLLRLMRAAGIRAQRGYRRPKGYYGGKPHRAASNLLERQFEVEKSNDWWVSDITYIHIHEGFLFLAVVMDLYALNIIGWSMGARITDDLVLDALTMAYWRRRPPSMLKLHSDQVSQCSSSRCKKLLKTLKITLSMSRRGNCHDNAVAESFFANVKKKKIRRRKYRTRTQARLEIFEYIELFYNPKRRHNHNGRLAPTVYEQQQLTK